MPITTVQRTLLDVAAAVTADELHDMLAAAMRLGWYSRPRLEDVIGRSNGHPGTGKLTRAIGAAGADAQPLRAALPCAGARSRAP